jgi:hypothetical protein
MLFGIPIRWIVSVVDLPLRIRFRAAGKMFYYALVLWRKIRGRFGERLGEIHAAGPSGIGRRDCKRRNK